MSSSSGPVVIGVDAGGTHVRALACDAAGTRLGTGAAEAANPTSGGAAAAARRIVAAVTEAASTVQTGWVADVVIGAAGALAHRSDLAEALQTAWPLECPWELRSDLEVAFAAGRPEDSGVVVVAGTGAAVAEIRDGRMVRCLDGAGWLLGDVGSGFWLGREAVRAVLAAFDGTAERTDLVGGVASALAVPADKWSIVRAAYAREPVRLAELAPLVGLAAAEGDAVAVRILDRAAAALVREVEMLLAGAEDLTAGVLAGGVLLAGGELAEHVGMALTTDHALAVGLARDGAAGAAWLALRRHGEPGAAVHKALTAG